MGDKETNFNRIGDLLATLIGWCIVASAFYFQERMIQFPWIWGDGCAQWPFTMEAPPQTESMEASDTQINPLNTITIFALLLATITMIALSIGFYMGYTYSKYISQKSKINV